MKPLVLALGFALLGGYLTAQDWDSDPSASPVPTTALARQSDLSQGLLAKTPVERLKPMSVRDPSGTRITVQLVHSGSGENRLWELRWEPGSPWGTGTWVAFRDGLGRLREVRVILLEGSDGTDHRIAQPGTWIRLVPQGRGATCRIDLFLAGRLVTGGWTVPASLLDAMQSSDSWLWETTSQSIDWNSLLPQRRWEDEAVEAVQIRIHKLLSTMPENRLGLWWPDERSSIVGTADTGAPWGTWLSLAEQPGPSDRGMGPWGVTLWTATGVLRSWKGDFPTWKSLMEQRIVLPGYSQANVPDDITTDPGFGLDWIRNLGLAVQRVLHPSRPLTNESADVRDLPFLDMVPGSGYAVDDFPALIHLLAVTRPGQVYLGSLSTQQADSFGSPAVRFQEPVVLLPWVGTDQRVRVSVFAGPKEVSWEQWLGQLPAGRQRPRFDHLVLVALPLPAKLEFPVLPAR